MFWAGGGIIKGSKILKEREREKKRERGRGGRRGEEGGGDLGNISNKQQGQRERELGHRPSHIRAWSSVRCLATHVMHLGVARGCSFGAFLGPFCGPRLLGASLVGRCTLPSQSPPPRPPPEPQRA